MKTITKFLIGYILLISILFGTIYPINAEPTYIKGSAIKPNTFYNYDSGLSIEVSLAGGTSGEVFTRTLNGYTWETPSSGVTDHLLLSNIGTLTHAQIEAALSNVAASTTAIVTAKEELSANDVVKIINNGGLLAYKYQTSSAISLGSEAAFNAGSTSDLTAVALTSTKIVVVYQDEDNSSYTTVCVGDISGNTITWGAEDAFDTNDLYYNLEIARLSDTKFVLTYVDGTDDTYYITAQIGTVTGTTVAWGAKSVPENVESYYETITPLSATKFVLSYSDFYNAGKPGHSFIGTIDGSNNISWGSVGTFGANVYYTASATIASDKFVVAFKDSGDTSLRCIVGAVDGSNNITFGTLATPDGDSPIFVGVAELTSTTFVLAYSDSGSTGQGTALVGTIDGSNDLTFGSPSIFESEVTTDIFYDHSTIRKLTSTSVAISYVINSLGELANLKIGTVADGTITWSGSPVNYEAHALPSYNIIAPLTSTSMAISYIDWGGDNSNHGKSIIADISDLSSFYSVPALVTTAITIDATGEVSMIAEGLKISSNNFSLAEGTKYYMNITTSAMGTGVTDYYIGYATDATTVYIDSINYLNKGGTTGYATQDWSTANISSAIASALGDYYTAAQTNATIESALSTVSSNIVLSAIAGDDLSAGDIVKIINSDGKVYKYLQQTLQNIGTPVYLKSGGTDGQYISSCLLDSTHVFIAFQDNTAGKGYGVIGTFVGPSTVSFGTPVYLVSGGVGCSYISSTTIDSTHVFVSFQNSTTGKSYGVVGTFTAPNAIAFGTPVYLVSGGVASSYISCANIDSTHVFVAFNNDADSKAYGVIGAYTAPDTIAFGTPVYLQSGGVPADHISCTKIDSTHVFVAFREAVGYLGYGVVGTFTAPDTIAFGTPVYLQSGGKAAVYTSCATIDATHVFIAFRGGDDYKGYGLIGIYEAPDTISFGTAVHLQNGGISAYYTSSCKIDDNRIFIGFQDKEANKGTSVIGTFTAPSTISFGTPVYLQTSGVNNDYITCTAIDANNVFAAYRDVSASKCYGVINNIPSVIPTHVTMLPAISDSSVSCGDTGTFTLVTSGSKYINSAYSLNARDKYWMDTACNLTTTSSGNERYYFGYALDTTSIFIDNVSFLNNSLTSSEILLNQINPLSVPSDSTAWGYKTATGYGYYPSSSIDAYTKAETDATIEAAIAAIPASSVNQTVTVTAGEALTAGQVVSLINESGTIRAYNIPLTVSTSPNGAESVFNTGATALCSATAIDSTKFVVAYVTGASQNPYLIAGTVSGSTITWGSASSVEGGIITNGISVAKLGTDKGVVFFDRGSDGLIRARAFTLSGTTISWGTALTLSNGGASGSYFSASQLTTDAAIMVYRDNGANNKGWVFVVTASGTDLTTGTDTYFNNAATAYCSVSALSATSAIVAYQDTANSSYGTAQVLSISGTTITPGTEYVFCEDTTTDISCASVSSTVSAITHRIGSNGGVLVATNSSGTLSYGALAAITDCQNGATSKIDSTHVLIAAEIGASNYGQSVVGTISGDTITLGTAYSYNTDGATSYNAVCYLGNNKSAIAYRDGGNTFGTAVVNTWATSSYASIAGISSGAYSSGSDAVVLIHGSYDGLSGLLTGSSYFLNSSFELQTIPVSLTSSIYSNSATTREIHVGKALSSTEILLDIDYR